MLPKYLRICAIKIRDKNLKGGESEREREREYEWMKEWMNEWIWGQRSSDCDQEDQLNKDKGTQQCIRPREQLT